MLTFAEYLNETNIISLSHSLGIARRDMPQIRSFNMSDYLSFLQSHGVNYHNEMIDASHLKPLQKEINVDYAGNLQKNQSHEKPMIVSRDNFILDGHHRWYQAMLAKESLHVIRVNIDMHPLLALTKMYPKVEYKNIISN